MQTDLPEPGRLMATTLELLRARPHYLTLKKIACEAGVTTHWLSMYAAGQIRDPSVNRVERIYEILTNKKLDV